MLHLGNNTRAILKISAAVLFCSLIPLRADGVSQASYLFTGTCSDCSGQGLGTLTVLSSYVPGTDLTAPNFVSFSYTNTLNTVNFTILSSDANLFLSGGLPTSLPGMSFVDIGGTGETFLSGVTGNWCAGLTCGADFGTAGVWNNATAGVPEPASVFFIAPAVFAFGWIRRRAYSRG